MIHTLYGKLFECDPLTCTVVIECGGVGYKTTVTANTIAKLPSPKFAPDGSELEGETVRLYTHMAVREDNVELFGFYTKEELDMFRLLISVSGIGPKAGMSILSLLTPSKLAAAVAAEDAKAISRAPGVGGKTAARVVLELKDKMAKAFPQFASSTGADEDIPQVKAAQGQSSKLADARDALAVLGYSRSEIAASLKNADPAASLEDIIRDALQSLMK
ncbi:MAG: Holliday junction branch migration protein RuvA [Ruminococcaceae bacterium]|nr:Holliday junction branch migration protein RuvA [Oscillospiraceae bacterium]